MKGLSILSIAYVAVPFQYKILRAGFEDHLLWPLLLEEGPPSVSNLSDATGTVYVYHRCRQK